MQTILLFLLAFIGRNIIKKHSPFVIGVTGTIGKTTISHHIAIFLEKTYGKDNVRYSSDHYNGEYGLPLTIIGAKTGGKNIYLWSKVFFSAIREYFSKKYPKYLVLEYGIDHPGEMEYLLSVVKPDISILSVVSPNHLEQFGSFASYRTAKFELVKHTKKLAIVHEMHRSLLTGENIRYYGTSRDSHAFVVSTEQFPTHLLAKIGISDETFDLSLSSFGSYQVENILPLFLLAEALEIPRESIISIQDRLLPEAGRSRILRGKGNSILIDGSYNGGYESLVRGLESVAAFQSSHMLYIVLGDMRELGKDTEKYHNELAETILKKFGDPERVVFFLVGPYMRQHVFRLLKGRYHGLATLSSRSVGEKLRFLLEGDAREKIVYFKGSQNTIFLEEAITSVLENPNDQKLLCRQDAHWKRLKDDFYYSLGTKFQESHL